MKRARWPVLVLIAIGLPILFIGSGLYLPSPLWVALNHPNRLVRHWVASHWDLSQGQVHEIEFLSIWLLWGVLPAFLTWLLFFRRKF